MKKQIEKILYGTKKGEPSYMEEILSEKEENFERVKILAAKDGYDRFRVAIIDLSVPPDFTKSVNI